MTKPPPTKKQLRQSGAIVFTLCMTSALLLRASFPAGMYAMLALGVVALSWAFYRARKAPD